MIFASRRFQPGEGPSRGLLPDYKPSSGPEVLINTSCARIPTRTTSAGNCVPFVSFLRIRTQHSLLRSNSLRGWDPRPSDAFLNTITANQIEFNRHAVGPIPHLCDHDGNATNVCGGWVVFYRLCKAFQSESGNWGK